MLIALVAISLSLSAQESINSIYQDYFNFLALTGEAEDPALMYHSLSNNEWALDGGHLWESRLGGSGEIFSTDNSRLRILTPELLVSGNTTYARTELSDGAWWQGRGINSFVSGGLKFETQYFSATLMPELWMAQNLAYDLLPAALAESDGFGYFEWSSIDYPQRMGDELLYEFGWGQSELRVNWKNLTLGFGNENILAGPSKVNSLMFSDNASGFPHVDFGLRKTETSVGEIELLGFRGRVEESDYFDDDSSNDYNFIHGILFGYSPSFAPGLTFGLKWSLMAQWEYWKENWYLQAFGFDFSNLYFGGDPIDQKGALTLQYKFPEVGFEWYFEFFREDYSPSIRYILLSPGHAAGYTLGGQKKFELERGRGFLATLEWNSLIQSRDYEIDSKLSPGGTYYTHGAIRQGFTNLGQMLGAGIGPGSEAETFLLDYYSEWGKAGIMVQRIVWNKDYLYGTPEQGDYLRLNTEMNFGLNGVWLTSRRFHFFADLILSYQLNYNYEEGNDKVNLYGNMAVNYRY